MSLDLPFLWGTSGVSSNAIYAARAQAGHEFSSGPSYQQRISALQATIMSKSTPTPILSSVAQKSVQSRQSGSQNVGSVPIVSQPSIVSQQQIAQMASTSAQKYASQKARVTALTHPLSGNSLLKNDGYSLQSIDFQAIADSSVGGAGLPRPYGRFVAAKGGDGTAVWERLPPSGVVVWPSKQSAQQKELTETDGQRQVTQSPQTWKNLEGRNQARSAYSLAPPRLSEPLFPPARAPVAERSGISLPAATFLTEAPSLPGNVRVDCGWNSSKEFLLSALNKPQIQPQEKQQEEQQQHVQEDEESESWALTMKEPVAVQQAVVPGKRVNLESQRYTALKSVLGAQIEEAMMSRNSESSTGGPSLLILNALTDAEHKSHHVTYPVGPDLGRPSRRIGELPSELSLPRRYVPAIGR